MKSTKILSLNLADELGQPHIGDFEVKLMLSIADDMEVDRQRRYIIGGSPEISAVPVAPARQADAFMLATLRVRIVSGADWWKNSDGGLNLTSRKLIVELFEHVEGAAADHKQALLDRAETARKELQKQK